MNLLECTWLFSVNSKEKKIERREEKKKRKRQVERFLCTPSVFDNSSSWSLHRMDFDRPFLGHESLGEDNPSTVELTSMVDLPQLRQRKARFQGIRYVPQPIRYFVPEHQPKPQEESTSETSTPPRLDIRNNTSHNGLNLHYCHSQQSMCLPTCPHNHNGRKDGKTNILFKNNAPADFFSDVNKLVPCGSPPSLSFIDKIFKSCQSDWLVRKRKVSSDDLSFARWLEKVSLAC